MKNLTLITILFICLTSCKKDRVCTCTNQDGSINSQATFTNVTKKEAKTYCTSVSQSVSCTIK